MGYCEASYEVLTIAEPQAHGIVELVGTANATIRGIGTVPILIKSINSTYNLILKPTNLTIMPKVKKRKYTKRAINEFNLDIDYDWTPSKVSRYDTIPLTTAIVNLISKVKPGGSIPLPMDQLKTVYGWKTPTAATSGLRNLLSKHLHPDDLETIKLHEVKNDKGVVAFVRIRRPK